MGSVGVGIGLALCVIPWLVVASRPGTLTSRLTIATAFMGYAALFIDEAHGDTVLHFYIFVELAFLIVYRDWRVPTFGAPLPTSTMVAPRLRTSSMLEHIFSQRQLRVATPTTTVPGSIRAMGPCLSSPAG